VAVCQNLEMCVIGSMNILWKGTIFTRLICGFNQVLQALRHSCFVIEICDI